MNSNLSRIESLILAVVMFAALTLGGIGLFAVGDSQGLWNRQVSVSAHFPNISGVQVGTRVRVKGINVGQVVAIEQPADRGGPVIVRMNVDHEAFALLGSDSRAVIMGEGLIGGKVIELDPGTSGSLEPGAVIPGEPDLLMERIRDLAENASTTLDQIRRVGEQTDAALKEAQGLVSDLRKGEGPTGQEVTSTLRDLQEASRSVAEVFQAMKKLPLLSAYVQTPELVLIRPDKISRPFVFEEQNLFELGTASLKESGKQCLDSFVAGDFAQFDGLKGIEIVIAAYTNSGSGGEAMALTQSQADAVRTYLMNQHRIHKPGWLSSGRTVTALGMGRKQSPISPPEGTRNLPPRRIEIIVFLPAEAELKGASSQGKQSSAK